MKVILRILLIVFGCSMSAQAQIAVKSNLLYDATLSPNLGAEIALAPKWSAELSGNINAWTLSDGKRWKHWLVQPEVRYWLCDRFSGHFFGAHLLGGQYNWGHLNLPFKFLGTDFNKLKDYRYQGWMGGAGIAYGYSWIINRHWNIEAEIGLGWVYTRSDVFECRDCGQKVQTGYSHNYVGPTKAAIKPRLYEF